MFKQANEQLDARSKEWSQTGQATSVKHKDPITNSDLHLVGKWIKTKAKEDPYALQRAIWFLHNFTGAKRGIEKYRLLEVKDVQFKIDDEQNDYVDICFDRVLPGKTYQCGLNSKTRDESEPGRIYKSDNDEIDLYSLLQFYLSKMRK